MAGGVLCRTLVPHQVRGAEEAKAKAWPPGHGQHALAQLVNMPEYKEGAKHPPVLERIQEGPEAAAPDLQMYF